MCGRDSRPGTRWSAGSGGCVAILRYDSQQLLVLLTVSWSISFSDILPWFPRLSLAQTHAAGKTIGREFGLGVLICAGLGKLQDFQP